MSSNPMLEYQFPSGEHTPDLPQTTEVIRDELRSIYENTNVIDFGLYRGRKVESVPSEHSEKLFIINDKLAEARNHRLNSHSFNTEQSSVVMALIKRLSKIKNTPIKPLTTQDLIGEESIKVGANLFDDSELDGHIEFFMDDKGDWYFYHEKTDSKGVQYSTTLHFEVLKTGILCINSNSGVKGEFLEGAHLDNFMLATQIYHDRVIEMYRYDHHLGKIAA